MSQPRVETIHIVDDDDSMRVALARVLGAAGYATRSYASVGEFLFDAGESPGGCLLLDLHMPGRDGLDLQELMARRGQSLPTVFLSGRGDIASSVRALKAGASDFLTKPVPTETLLAAVREALDAEGPRQAERALQHGATVRYATLTERERSVLAQVVQGALTKQIAQQLGVSERTVKACRASVMDKMGAGSLPELVRLAAALPEPGRSIEAD
jgi:FixJ family two-component response regulator